MFFIISIPISGVKFGLFGIFADVINILYIGYSAVKYG